jgi:two-component system sensor histidine kinase YesM
VALGDGMKKSSTGPRRTLKSPFKSLSVNVFLMILIFLLVPIYISFILMKNSYENYIGRELGNQITANIKRGEDEFYEVFRQMANISNLFTQDENLIAFLRDPNSNYQERNQQFDKIVKNILINNLFDLDDIKITMIDTQDQTYANWSLNFNDYSFILNEDWIRISIINRGHISWSFFSPSFVENEKDQYISLARSILFPSYSGERIATLIVSISQRAIGTILSRYGAASDFVRICTRETMEEVFAMGNINDLRHEDIIKIIQKTAEENRGSLLCELNEVRYLLSYYTLQTPWTFNGQPLVVLHFTNYQHITDQLSVYSRNINFGLLAFLLVLFVIMITMSYTITRPIRLLAEKVKQYAQTREIREPERSRQDEIGTLDRTFFDMEIKINDLFDRLKQESEIREQYRFQALRAQINPHFLFNTLNTIRWMSMIRKVDNITDTIDALVRMLEYSIRGEWEFVPLGKELDMIRNYLHIQNYRYGEDFEVSIDIPKELEEYRIIKFILQPIVENAFLHAFKNIVGRKKVIQISGLSLDGQLKLFVRDNGVGMAPEAILELNESFKLWDKKRAAGIGLSNVCQRIKIEHGDEFGLYVENVSSGGTVVEYTLPLLMWEDNT